MVFKLQQEVFKLNDTTSAGAHQKQTGKQIFKLGKLKI